MFAGHASDVPVPKLSVLYDNWVTDIPDPRTQILQNCLLL